MGFLRFVPFFFYSSFFVFFLGVPLGCFPSVFFPSPLHRFSLKEFGFTTLIHAPPQTDGALNTFL